jgi:hypothetical protein
VSPPGCHIILTREDTKRLFGADGDDEVRAVVTDVLRRKKEQGANLYLNCGDAWDPIHRCLTEGTLAPDGGEFPANHCILGGRQLHEGVDFEAVLVRPDIVRHVAEAIHRVKSVDFETAYKQLTPEDYGREPTEIEFEVIWALLSKIRKLFEDAAELGEAVLFVVERETTGS